MPRAEIARSIALLFKNVDLLESYALENRVDDSSGAVLRSLNEYNVRSISGEAIYGAGLQTYIQGRVSEKRFSSDTLSGKVDEKSLSGVQFFEPTITLERKKNSKKIHAYGYCACNFGAEGSLCPHMAALMVAWVRKRGDFGFASEKDFEIAKTRVVDSTRQVLDLITKSPKSTDLDLLHKTYSKLRLWTGEVRDSKSTALRDFSWTINYVSLALISAIGAKYEISAIDLYNKNTVSTFGKVLDLITEKNLARRSKARSKGVSSRAARSWDKLVENFVK